MMLTISAVRFSLILAAFVTVHSVIVAPAPVIAGGVQVGPGEQRSEMVIIDGSKNPELLPEWLVWQTTFRSLALLERENAKIYKVILVLSDEERALLHREARLQAERDRACIASLDQRHKELSAAGVRPELMQKDLQDLEVDCRWKILEARDRVLAGFSPEGQISLLNWVAEDRRTIRSYVSRDGLDHYRRPK